MIGTRGKVPHGSFPSRSALVGQRSRSLHKHFAGIGKLAVPSSFNILSRVSLSVMIWYCSGCLWRVCVHLLHSKYGVVQNLFYVLCGSLLAGINILLYTILEVLVVHNNSQSRHTHPTFSVTFKLCVRSVNRHTTIKL